MASHLILIDLGDFQVTPNTVVVVTVLNIAFASSTDFQLDDGRLCCARPKVQHWMIDEFRESCTDTWDASRALSGEALGRIQAF